MKNCEVKRELTIRFPDDDDDDDNENDDKKREEHTRYATDVDRVTSASRLRGVGRVDVSVSAISRRARVSNIA